MGTSQFDFFIESPRDPEVTTILSITAHSMIVFRTHARPVGEIGRGPHVVAVHVVPEEIDTTQADVNRVEGLLYVQVPEKRWTSELTSHLVKNQQQGRNGVFVRMAK
jgi:hypothetical protein